MSETDSTDSKEAVGRARELFHMTPDARPFALKHIVDKLSAYNLSGLVYDSERSPYDLPSEGDICSQRRMALYVLYAEIVEGLPCKHSTYGTANLPKLVGEKIRNVIEGITGLPTAIFSRTGQQRNPEAFNL